MDETTKRISALLPELPELLGDAPVRSHLVAELVALERFRVGS
jgi:hypothetical protein